MRDPTVINVSYFFPLKDDETLPSSKDSLNSSLPAMRGACALTAIAEYRKDVCSGQFPIERFGSKKIPLCSAQYKYHLHSCRIPDVGTDRYELHDPSLHKHCIVACEGQFFAMDFVDDCDNPLPLSQLENGLQLCIDLAKGNQNEPQLGFFTTSNRDEWAKNRKLLLSEGGEAMNDALETIQSAAAVICLNEEASSSALDDFGPDYWHGGKTSTMNRWFDKPIQIVCQGNGRLAYMGEHSMVDGMPTMRVCDRIDEVKYSMLSSQSEKSEDFPFITAVFDESTNLVKTSHTIQDTLEKGEKQID